MSNQLSQEEINAILEDSNTDGSNSNEAIDNLSSEEGDEYLSEEERDAIGEISNISMGSASTALSTLLNTRVNITTPHVSYSTWDELSSTYDKPCVLIQIYYKEGLDGSNILVIKEEDVKYITDIMMGGDGSNLPEELTELHLSAISEAMNQMMGSASTSLSSILNTKVDITPPTALMVNLNDELEDVVVESYLKGKFVKVSFDMAIGEKVDTNIIQLYPFEFAHNIYYKFMESYGLSVDESSTNNYDYSEENYSKEDYLEEESKDINIQSALFQTLTNNNISSSQLENIDIIMDVTLEVSVELGRTKKSIKEILDFSPGTIIELDKLSGDPVDVLVNSKTVAKGEVVVIDESFGVRIIEVLSN